MSRRWARLGLATLLIAGVAAAFAGVWLRTGAGAVEVFATVVAAVLALAVPLAAWALRPWSSTADGHAEGVDRLAEQLAAVVRRQWEVEADVRQLRDPQPLSVRWSEADPALADWPEVILAPAEGRGRPLHSAARRLSPSGNLDRVAEIFEALPRRRLVVIGQPGSGKSGVLLLLVLELLRRRRQGRPVPVLVTPSSWDPRRQPLLDWLAVHLAREYPLLRPAGSRALVERGLVLPFLDGLDEMPGQLPAQAIEAINRAGPQLPLVVACRSLEFGRAVHAGDVLTGAAVVELEPVGAEEACDYLRLTTPRDDRAARWQPVFEDLRRGDDGPLAAALSTPLMVSLARAVYALDRSVDPAELIDRARFPTREAIEDRLLDALIPAAFGPDPARRVGRRWEPAQAWRWGAGPARHLERRDSRDLAWWELAPTGLAGRLAVALGAQFLTAAAAALALGTDIVLSTGRAHPVYLALSSGLVFGFGLLLGTGVALELWPPHLLRSDGTRLAWLRIGLWLGLLYGISYGDGLLSTRTAGPVVTPAASLEALSALAAGLEGSAVGFALGVALRLWPAHVALRIDRALFRWLAGGVLCGSVSALLALGRGGSGMLVVFEFLFGFLSGLVFLVLLRLGLQVRPAHIVLRIDRMLVRWLAVGALAGLAVGLAMGLADGLVVGLVYAIVFGLGLALVGGLCFGLVRTSDRPPSPGRSLRSDRTAAILLFAGPGLAIGLADGLVGGPFTGLASGLQYAVPPTALRPWSRYQVVRGWLAIRGRLPWRLMAFLEEAHRRGILRQVGAVYQFRHARLQDRLCAGDHLP